MSLTTEARAPIITAGGMGSLRRWQAFVLIAGACCLVYANSLQNQFVFDDLYTIVNDPSLRHFDFPGLFKNWFRPIRTFSLVIDYWIWGLNPSGFRMTNILLHCLNSWMVFVLLARIAKDERAALIAAMIFAVHPIQTDAVTYISGRRDVLFTLFYLLSFYSFMRFKREHRSLFAAGSLIAFGLSILTKEMAATLPAILLLWEVYERWDPQPGGSLLREATVRIREVLGENRWILAAGILILTSFLTLSIMAGQGLGSPRALNLEYWGGSPWNNLLTVLTVHMHYLSLLVWPGTLVASYQGDFPIAGSLMEGRVLAAIALLCALILGFAYCLRRYKVFSFGLAFYAITLLPVSQIIPHHELLAEHFLYLPMAGFALIVGVGLSQLAAKSAAWERPAYGLACAVILALGVRTVARNRDWKDPLTLWQATFQAVPLSPRAAYNLGVEHLKLGRAEQSIPLLQRAIQLDPDHILAYNNLASAYLAKGDVQLALATFERALALKPLNPDTIVWGKRDVTYRFIRRNMAKCYLRLNQPASALALVQQAIRIRQGDPESYALMAEIYAGMHRSDEAIGACREGLRAYPASPELRLTLAGLLAGGGQWEEATALWQSILADNPSNDEAGFRMAFYAIDHQQMDAALRHLNAAGAPSLPQARLKDLMAEAGGAYQDARRYRLASEAYRLLQQSQEAIEVCKAGLAAFPDDRQIRLTLAFLYVNQRRLDDAAGQWKKVIETNPEDFLANLNLGTYSITKGDRVEAQRYLNIAFAHAPDDAGREQVRRLLLDAQRLASQL